jgi:hypothetical protein
MPSSKFESCPSGCKGTTKKTGKAHDRTFFKVQVNEGRVWLLCGASGSCPWRVELTGEAARAFLPTTH